MKEEIISELNKLNIKDIKNYEVIKESENTVLYKIVHNDKHLVIKYYNDLNNSYEISWYKALKKLKVKTLDMVNYTKRMIVFNDLDYNSYYRFGEELDMNNENIAFRLGKWFKKFHEKGYKYLKNNTMQGLQEADLITQANISRLVKSIKENNGTGIILKENLDLLQERYHNLEKTFVYRDFWYVNFIISKDESDIFIYDYDKSGTGLSYIDILYMKMSLSKRAQNAFMKGYGKIKKEEIDLSILNLDLYRLISYLDYMGEEEVPGWAKYHLEKYMNGELKETILNIISR